MGFMRRTARQPADPRPAISRFWDWWAERRDEVVAAAEADQRDELRSLLAPAVAALDAGLEWELTAGEGRRFVLALSAGNDDARRAVTERWMVMAPDDADVEFAPARRPRTSGRAPVLHVDGFDIDLGELVAGTGVDPRRATMDVVVHHPLFPLLPEHERTAIASRGLAVALGDDDVRRWVGTVTVSSDAPVDAIPMSMLAAVADQLRPAQGPWVTLHGAGRGGRPVTATVRMPLIRLERPLADTHVAVVLRYAAGRDGMPADDHAASEADELQERVLQALGGDGPHAVLAGHVIGGGQIVEHFYVDSLEVDTSVVEPTLSSWRHGAAVARVRFDPAWDEMAPLRP